MKPEKRDLLRRKLLAAARHHAPREHVPYAFEQRILARLESDSKVDALAWWSRHLWQGAVACVLLSIIATAIAFAPFRGASAHVVEQLDETLLVSVDDMENAQ